MIHAKHGPPAVGLVPLARMWQRRQGPGWVGRLGDAGEGRVWLFPPRGEDDGWALMVSGGATGLARLAELLPGEGGWPEGPLGLAWVVFKTQLWPDTGSVMGTLYLAVKKGEKP